jgi:hypothetical protein
MQFFMRAQFYISGYGDQVREKYSFGIIISWLC